MTHLTPDELIDAMESLLTADRQAHLATCEHCQAELASLSDVLAEAKQTSVPEPSPLFWQHFSERVRTAIDDDGATGNNWLSWLRWQVVVPLGAVAMIVVSLTMALPKQNSVNATQFADEAVIAPDAPSPDNWVMVANLVGDLDLDTAVAAGVVVQPGDAEEAVLQLTSEEQQELTRLLKAELTRAKS